MSLFFNRLSITKLYTKDEYKETRGPWATPSPEVQSINTFAHRNDYTVTLNKEEKGIYLLFEN